MFQVVHDWRIYCLKTRFDERTWEVLSSFLLLGTFSTAPPSSLAPLKCLSFPDVPATVFYGLIKKKYCRYTETPTLLLHITLDPLCRSPCKLIRDKQWCTCIWCSDKLGLIKRALFCSLFQRVSHITFSYHPQPLPPPLPPSFCKPLTPFPCGDESNPGGEAWICCFLSQHGVKMAHTYIKPHTSAHAALCWGSMWSDVTGSPIKSTKRSSLRGFRCSKLPLINLNEHCLSLLRVQCQNLLCSKWIMSMFCISPAFLSAGPVVQKQKRDGKYVISYLR